MALRIGYVPDWYDCEINNLNDVQRCSAEHMLPHIRCISPESVKFLPFDEHDYDEECANETIYGALKSNVIDVYLDQYIPLLSKLHNYATYGAVFADTPYCFYNQRRRVRETKNLLSFAEPLTSSVNFYFLILLFVSLFVLNRMMERAARKFDCPIMWTSVSVLGQEFQMAFILFVYSSLMKAQYAHRELTVKKFTTATELANKIIKGELIFVQTYDIPDLELHFENFLTKGDSDVLISALNQSQNVDVTGLYSLCKRFKDDDRIVYPSEQTKVLKMCKEYLEYIDETCFPLTPTVMRGTLFSKRSSSLIEKHSQCVQHLSVVEQKITQAARQDQMLFSRDHADTKVVAVPLEYIAIPIAIWSFGMVAAGICLALENYAR